MNRTSMLIFSYNRPMQLDLLLKTLRNSIGYLKNIDIYVLYGATSDEFLRGYSICKDENTCATFICQSDFYQNIKSLVASFNSDFVLFCTDDTIFIREFLMEDIEKAFDKHKTLLNFSLRLGENTTFCYPLNKKQLVPEHNNNNNKIFYWNWKDAEYDFGYPLEVSSTALRIVDVKKFIETWHFSNPNWMEWYMDMFKNNFSNKPLSAAFSISVAFSAPMNKVNRNNNNRFSGKEK